MKLKTTMKRSTGWGVTDDDISKGITTIAAKLEASCAKFMELDMLYGSRQNVDPSHVEEPTTPHSPEPVAYTLSSSQPMESTILDSTEASLLDP
jgi:hypothetical protein